MTAASSARSGGGPATSSSMATLLPFQPLATSNDGSGGGTTTSKTTTATTMMAQIQPHQPQSHQMTMMVMPPHPTAAGQAQPHMQAQQVAFASAGFAQAGTVPTHHQRQQQQQQQAQHHQENPKVMQGRLQEPTMATAAPHRSQHHPAMLAPAPAGSVGSMPFAVIQQQYQQHHHQQHQPQRFVPSVSAAPLPVVHGSNHDRGTGSSPASAQRRHPHHHNHATIQDVVHGGHQVRPQQQQQQQQQIDLPPPRKKARGSTSASEAAGSLPSLDHQQANTTPLGHHHGSIKDNDDASFTDDFAELDRLFEEDLYTGCLGGLANVGNGSQRSGQSTVAGLAPVPGPAVTQVRPVQSLGMPPSSASPGGVIGRDHPSMTIAPAIDQTPDPTPQAPVASVDHLRGVGSSNLKVRDADAAAGSASSPSSSPSNSTGGRPGGGGSKKASPSGGKYKAVPTLGSTLPPSSPSSRGSDDREESQRQKGEEGKANECKAQPSKKKTAASKESPMEYLHRSLIDRGYPKPVRRNYADLGYDRRPSPLQLASFGTRLVRAVHSSDASLLTRLLRSGLSPNPCNAFGDSIVNTVCKRGQFELLKCLVGHGATLRTADGFGRTPLHHAAWAGPLTSFDVVDLVLDEDVELLFVSDRHGKTPLEYVSKDMWSGWIHFLERRMDKYWPRGGAAARAREERNQGSHPSIRKDGVVGHEEVLEDPPNALLADVAAMVANGTMDPEDAVKAHPGTNSGSKNKETGKKLFASIAA